MRRPKLCCDHKALADEGTDCVHPKTSNINPRWNALPLGDMQATDPGDTCSISALKEHYLLSSQQLQCEKTSTKLILNQELPCLDLPTATGMPHHSSLSICKICESMGNM